MGLPHQWVSRAAISHCRLTVRFRPVVSIFLLPICWREPAPTAPVTQNHCLRFHPTHSFMQILSAKAMCGRDSGPAMENSLMPLHFGPWASRLDELCSTIEAASYMRQVTSPSTAGRAKSACNCGLPTLQPADCKSTRVGFRPIKV